MIRAILKKNDGMRSGRPWLASVVESVQGALAHAGEQVSPDGQFGPGTQKAVKNFQTRAGVAASGIVEKSTWKGLKTHLDATAGERERHYQEHLVKFDGDLNWVHAREGHAGKPYWPKGESGITLDPGVDLGHASPDLFRELYATVLSASEIQTLSKFLGYKGVNARDALRNEPALASIRVSRQQAFEIMPYAAKSYWNSICARFRPVALKTTPPSVKTVMLSLAYNRGAYNKHLEPLGALLEARQWQSVADAIGKMQQNHELVGIRTRRREEASLVRAELEFLQ